MLLRLHGTLLLWLGLHSSKSITAVPTEQYSVDKMLVVRELARNSKVIRFTETSESDPALQEKGDDTIFAYIGTGGRGVE